MALFQIAILALVQGITEFLPISSSGHLILVPIVAGWPDQGLTVDIAVHVGTLAAVVVYFHRDVAALIGGGFGLLAGRRDANTRLAWFMIVGTVPVVIAGLAASRYLGDALRSIEVIGWTTLVFGIALWLADRKGATARKIEDMHLPDAVIIGLAQALAIIPGTSRSGITMTAARFLGMERRDGARFSMLLSIPVIIGAGSLQGWKLYQSGDAQLTMAA
ncbi:MAG: undecaprenyl-diphosphate phosphatase, partial [Proteobacteria bacterium]|nr:undecaprenyl-diphosphate phosphatase [Pseudomonadota bacterium]